MLTTRHCKQILICTLLLATTATTIATESTQKNAADIYRKAFKLYKPDGDMRQTLTHLAEGKVELDQSIIKHVSANKKVIDMALEASRIENCDWDFNFPTLYPSDPNVALSESKQKSDNHLAMMRIAYLLLADAKVNAHNSEIKNAVDEVFAAYAMSRHVYAESTFGYLTTINLELRIDNVITEILSEHELNSTMLNFIERHLDHHIKTRHPLKKTFGFETQYGLDAINQATPEIVEELSHTLFRMIDNDPNFIEFMESANVKYSDLDRDYYLKHRQKLRKTIDMPYSKAIAAIKELNDAMVADAIKFSQDERDVSVNSTAFLMQIIASPSFWSKVHTGHILTKTRFNALLTAIDIYKIKAKSGKLPDNIPTGSPKDLFSDEDFAYKKTAAGFILRSKGRRSPKEDNYEWEFKVAK